MEDRPEGGDTDVPDASLALDSDGPDVPFGTFRPTERRVLIGCAFGAMCILLLPQELIAAGICAVIGIALYFWHRARTRSERAAAWKQEAAARGEVQITAAPGDPSPSSGALAAGPSAAPGDGRAAAPVEE